jgi:glycerophosphoryl diester phosphodiesterase
VLVIAHRGASFDFPENTLPAFERAIEIGADYVEFDVHPDREGALVVTHDPPHGAHPRLEEVLDLCHGRIGVMVELKRPGRHRGIVPGALALMHDDDVLVCFQRAALEEARALRPAIRTVQHVGFGVSIRRAAGAWAAGFQNERVTPRGLEAARGLGLETTVYTVNDEARIVELEQLGVSGIFTDCPDRALAALGRRPGG